MVALDLEEIDQVFHRRWLWGRQLWKFARYCAEDHRPEGDTDLKSMLQRLHCQHGAQLSDGPVQLLCHLRYFGYVFNPLSLFLCRDPQGQLQTVVAEVRNTPWQERHHYVLQPKHFLSWPSAGIRKDFHVSPFLPMDMNYHWRIEDGEKLLTVHLENHRQGQTVFDVTMQLQKRPMTSGWMSWMLVRYPLMTWQVTAEIYLHALRLWWKGAAFHVHPRKLASASAADLQTTTESPENFTHTMPDGTTEQGRPSMPTEFTRDCSSDR